MQLNKIKINFFLLNTRVYKACVFEILQYFSNKVKFVFFKHFQILMWVFWDGSNLKKPKASNLKKKFGSLIWSEKVYQIKIEIQKTLFPAFKYNLRHESVTKWVKMLNIMFVVTTRSTKTL